MGISIRAFGRQMGVTHAAVQKAIADGRITTLADGTIDPKKAERDWTANTHPGRGKGGRPSGKPGSTTEPPDVSDGYRAARAILATYDARLRELEYKRLTRELVDSEQVRKAAFDKARKARDLLKSIPSRIAPVVAGLTDAAECYRVIEDEVNRVCDELAAE